VVGMIRLTQILPTRKYTCIDILIYVYVIDLECIDINMYVYTIDLEKIRKCIYIHYFLTGGRDDSLDPNTSDPAISYAHLHI
jgi:hypothetical protein